MSVQHRVLEDVVCGRKTLAQIKMTTFCFSVQRKAFLNVQWTTSSTDQLDRSSTPPPNTTTTTTTCCKSDDGAKTIRTEQK